MTSVTFPGNSPISPLDGHDYTIDSTTTVGVSVLPDVAGGSAKGLDDSLPSLPLPSASPLSLESLLNAINNEMRQQSCRDGLSSIEAKGKEQEKVNLEKVDELKEQMGLMEEKDVLSIVKKVFEVIGIALAAVASVVSIVVGCLTANPLLVTAGVLAMVSTIDGITSMASDGEYSMISGFTELGKAMGMSDEDAGWFALATQLYFTIGTIACSFGGAAASSATTILKTGTQLSQQTFNAALAIEKVANVASGVNQTVMGAIAIADTTYEFQVAMTQVDSKELDAILEKIQMALDIEQALVETRMERSNGLLTSVKDIIDGCVQTQGAILTGSPQMA